MPGLKDFERKLDTLIERAEKDPDENVLEEIEQFIWEMSEFVKEHGLILAGAKGEKNCLAFRYVFAFVGEDLDPIEICRYLPVSKEFKEKWNKMMELRDKLRYISDVRNFFILSIHMYCYDSGGV